MAKRRTTEETGHASTVDLGSQRKDCTHQEPRWHRVRHVLHAVSLDFHCRGYDRAVSLSLSAGDVQVMNLVLCTSNMSEQQPEVRHGCTTQLFTRFASEQCTTVSRGIWKTVVHSVAVTVKSRERLEHFHP